MDITTPAERTNPPGQTSALLRRIPLFANLPEAEIELLGTRLEPRRYRRGEIICRQGDPGDHLFIVESGQVRIYTLSAEGGEHSIDILTEGDFFGEMAILDGLPRSAYASALRASALVLLRRRDFLSHLQAYPQTATRILETISRRLRHTLEYTEELVSLDVRRRLIKKLLELADRLGRPEPGGQGVRIDLELTQDTLASLAGTTRETVNRLLSDLREAAVVRADRGRIVIADPAELRRLLHK
jgi:CRP-like cAMP-binding protein